MLVAFEPHIITTLNQKIGPHSGLALLLLSVIAKRNIEDEGCPTTDKALMFDTGWPFERLQSIRERLKTTEIIDFKFSPALRESAFNYTINLPGFGTFVPANQPAATNQINN